MSSAYNQYGGNPYSQAEQGYGGQQSHELQNLPVQDGQTQYGAEYGTQQSTYVQPLDQRAFLQQVQNIRDLLKDFERDTQEVSQLHSRLLDAADSSSSSDLGRNLQNIEANVLSRNDQIRRQILKLAQDAANTTDSAKSMKHTQIGPLKKEFQNRITVYQEEEKRYRTNRQEQARRQFLIVNPDATDAELAAVADYSSDAQSEGIFQMALNNRRGQAQSAMSAVRSRHEELQRIEKTIIELAAMFNDMDQLVVAQEPVIERTEHNAVQTQEDVGKGNQEVDKAIKHARNRNKLKWYCLLIVILIIVGIALGVGLGVGLNKAANN